MRCPVWQYVEDSGFVWPLLVDEKRELYRGYGMLAASFWDIWGPKNWWAYLKDVLYGQKLQRSQGDSSQRGGDVLIDPTGMVRLHHVGEGPGGPAFGGATSGSDPGSRRG